MPAEKALAPITVYLSQEGNTSLFLPLSDATVQSDRYFVSMNNRQIELLHFIGWLKNLICFSQSRIIFYFIIFKSEYRYGSF